jgi:hypothetical protein
MKALVFHGPGQRGLLEGGERDPSANGRVAEVVAGVA